MCFLFDCLHQCSLSIVEGFKIYNLTLNHLKTHLQGTGLELRGPIIGIFAYPTIVIFCEGLGIGVARALIECGPEEGGLLLSYRQDVRLYYRVRFSTLDPETLCFLPL